MAKRKTRQEKSAAQAEPAAQPAISFSHCSTCGEQLPGSAAKICVRCFSQLAVRCTECTNERGNLLKKYLLHWYESSDKAFNEDGDKNTTTDKPCRICGEPHKNTRFQLRCKKCDNKRYVILPKKAVATDVGSDGK